MTASMMNNLGASRDIPHSSAAADNKMIDSTIASAGKSTGRSEYATCIECE
jgi:hypothetical protein